VPELPEVETARRELQPAMEGARFTAVVARRPDLRTPFPKHFVSRLEGHTVRRLDRRGKYLMAELSSGETLVMHLGMSGSFRVETGPADAHAMAGAHDHVVFQMSSGATVTFNDPRRFGFMTLIGPDTRHAALAAMGPEPLSAAFDAAALAAACRGKKTSLKAALLDQRVVAGIGNIYACEALHRARLSPRRRASTIATRAGRPQDAALRLTTAIKAVLEDAIRGLAEGSDRFRVYDRDGARCPRRGCAGTIKRIVQGGRSTFFCPVCQR
jgi:formamidopyrimidine-DNA glycosylase